MFAYPLFIDTEMEGKSLSVNTFSRIFLHLTWHTKHNEPMIVPTLESQLHQFLRQKALETRMVEVLAVGGIEDHVHLAVRTPPTLLVSQWVGQLKGASSFHFNQVARRTVLLWQEGYGVVSFGGRSVDFVVRYIQNQRKHHREGTSFRSLETISTEEN